MPLSPLAHRLVDELTLVPHEGVQILEGRTREIDAALQELRHAGLVTGHAVLQVVQPNASTSRLELLLVKVSATRAVLHRIVMDASHCGSSLKVGTWVNLAEAPKAERCKRCFPTRR